MSLKEEAVGSERLCCKCHSRYELTVSTSFSPSRTRALHRVSAVHDDGIGETLHIGDIAEIDDKVVVALNISAFGKPDVIIA